MRQIDQILRHKVHHAEQEQKIAQEPVVLRDLPQKRRQQIQPHKRIQIPEMIRSLDELRQNAESVQPRIPAGAYVIDRKDRRPGQERRHDVRHILCQHPPQRHVPLRIQKEPAGDHEEHRNTPDDQCNKRMVRNGTAEDLHARASPAVHGDHGQHCGQPQDIQLRLPFGLFRHGFVLFSVCPRAQGRRG